MVLQARPERWACQGRGQAFVVRKSIVRRWACECSGSDCQPFASNWQLGACARHPSSCPRSSPPPRASPAFALRASSRSPTPPNSLGVGPDGQTAVAVAAGADTVVTGVVGVAGLVPTIAAIKLGRTIALANKETLVCAAPRDGTARV